MKQCVGVFLFFLLFVSGFSYEREGVRVPFSETVFLQPPSDFAPRFEVAGCFCEFQEKVLFLFRNAKKPQGSRWCVPGGKLEKEETPEEALIREVREEIGVELQKEPLRYCRPVYVRFPTAEFILHLFRFPFPDEPPPLHLALDEHTDYRWVDYEEISDLDLIPGGKECFDIVFEDKLCGDFDTETSL